MFSSSSLSLSSLLLLPSESILLTDMFCNFYSSVQCKFFARTPGLFFKLGLLFTNSQYLSSGMSFAQSTPTSLEFILGGHQGPSQFGASPPYLYSSCQGSNSSFKSSQEEDFDNQIFFLVCSSRKPFTVCQIMLKRVDELTMKTLADVHLYWFDVVSKNTFKF